MKYFTLEWWNGVQEFEGGKDPLEEYGEYFDSVKPKLPNAFIEMHENVFLHDGALRELSILPHEFTLVMKIDTDDGKGNLRKVTLVYSGLTLFSSTADADNGLPGPRGYGDFGYDEVEVLTDGLLEHRILFSSGIVFIVRFSDVKLKYVDSN